MAIPTAEKRSRKRKVGDGLVAAGLFAGIGGFEAGFADAGAHIAMLCENGLAARSVLKHRFPGVELAGDVRDVRQIPKGVNVLTAGFPCQDLSSSGEKKGIRGHRSSLVGEVFRILKDSDIKWIVIENVPFMLQLNKGSAIATITSSLEKLGYTWAYRVLDSKWFGLPHRRKRVFLVASKTDDPRGVLLADDFPLPIPPEPSLEMPLGFYWTEGAYSVGLAVNAIPPLKIGSTIGIPSPPAILLPTGEVVVPNIKDGERLQGFKPGWTEPAEDVVRASFRWSLVGNAVSVNVTKWLARKLLSPSDYFEANDQPLSRGDKWPMAAWGRQGKRFSVQLCGSPLPIKKVGLDSFLKYQTKPLSPKGTLGFLKRARKGGLRFPEGFLEALDRHADHLQTLS